MKLCCSRGNEAVQTSASSARTGKLLQGTLSITHYRRSLNNNTKTNLVKEWVHKRMLLVQSMRDYIILIQDTPQTVEMKEV